MPSRLKKKKKGTFSHIKNVRGFVVIHQSMR
jgi:hypothetical protein